MMNHFLTYMLAIVTTGTALLLMLLLDPIIHLTQASFLLFFGAVALAALYGGRDSGIVATLLSAGFASYFFLEPQHHWTIDLPGSLRIMLFSLQGLLISVLIGDLKRAQEQSQKSLKQLRQSEQRFRRLIESNLFGVACGDADGKIYYANDYFLRMVGYDRADLAAGYIRWPDMTPPELLYLDEAAKQELQQIGVATPFEKEYIRKDGRRVPVLIGVAMIQEPDSEERESICFYIDLTDRRQVESAWQKGKQILDALMEYIPEGITIADAPDVTIREVSKHGQQLTGRPLEMLKGIPATKHVENWGFLHADGMTQPSAHELPLTRAVQKSAVIVNEEWVLQRPDGSKINLLCNAGPIQDSGGNTTGGILAWRDITERKQLLERERAARTEAEAANRVKDEFLAILSHELRSPLNPILGWSKLLQTKKLDEAKVAEALKIIERNAQMQAELIEDLLDVSRILRGKLSLNVSTVYLSPVVQAAIETVRLAAEAKSIQLDTYLETGLEPVAGDPSRLQQIVWNLLSNAVKFTPEGGRVEVRLEKGSKKQEAESNQSRDPEDSKHPIFHLPSPIPEHAQIIISDTGKGIAPDFLPYVFEYFRQADASITRQFGGLGLGLAIVRHLVELHGGTVQANSAGEGMGATFIVDLPLISTQSTSRTEIHVAHSAQNLKGIQILVVDDDADTRDFVTFVLEQAGADVVTVASASEALNCLIHSQPHLLLSDIGMPEMDGYRLIRQVRTLPPDQGGQIPAIALTAYAGEKNQRQTLAAGFQLHLSKPVEPDCLISSIASLVVD